MLRGVICQWPPPRQQTALVLLFLSANAVLAERRVGLAGLGAVLEGDAESVVRFPRPPRAVAGPPAKLVATLGVLGCLEIHRVFLKYVILVFGVW